MARRLEGVRTLFASIVVSVVVAACGFVPGSGAGPVATPTPVAVVPSMSVIMGSENLPAQVDGERVYRVTEQAEWEQLSGSFLLAATPAFPTAPCAGGLIASGNSAAYDLIGTYCSSPALTSLVYAAPKSPALGSVWDWLNHAAVFQVHTHDSEAAECGALLDECEAAVVVDALVWPIVPTEIDGEHVYGGSDYFSLNSAGSQSGSFLLGGVVSVESAESTGVTTACSSAPAERRLVASCGGSTWFAIAGEGVAPKSDFHAVDGQVVVVRAHLDDAEAVDCSEDMMASCEYAMVVEAVVWTSNPYAPATPAPPVQTTTPSAT